jgi:competence protein ComGF
MSTQTYKKNVNVLNNRGFTLVEMLLAFSIFSLIVSFLPLMLPIIIDERPLDERIQRLEWEVFISQIKKEIRMGQRVTVLNQRIQLEMDGQIIIYEKYGSNLRRRVDGKGHEILIQKVEDFRFEKLVNGILVTITDTYGHQYREEIRVLLRDVVF